MRHQLTFGIAAVALIVSIWSSSRALATDIEPSFEDEKSTFDKQNKLHLEAVADLNAPADKVYQALTSPEKVAKFDPRITGVKVVSQNATGKVVEFKGQTLPIPNAPPTLRVKYTFNPADKHVTAESVGKALIQFRADYTIKPAKDGKSTEIRYTSVSSNAPVVMGVDAPQFMRRDAALNAFMNNLRNAGKFIQGGAK